MVAERRGVCGVCRVNGARAAVGGRAGPRLFQLCVALQHCGQDVLEEGLDIHNMGQRENCERRHGFHVIEQMGIALKMRLRVWDGVYSTRREVERTWRAQRSDVLLLDSDRPSP